MPGLSMSKQEMKYYPPKLPPNVIFYLILVPPTVSTPQPQPVHAMSPHRQNPGMGVRGGEGAVVGGDPGMGVRGGGCRS